MESVEHTNSVRKVTQPILNDYNNKKKNEKREFTNCPRRVGLIRETLSDIPCTSNRIVLNLHRLRVRISTLSIGRPNERSRSCENKRLAQSSCISKKKLKESIKKVKKENKKK